MTPAAERRSIPRLPDDYSEDAVSARRDFLSSVTGIRPARMCQSSLDPRCAAGNVENFIGAAQVPVGVAGPLLVHGEHARGEFYVPLATTEGTLVASYNRGMRFAYEAGGVTVSVVADRMQRAPVFGFDSAAQARTFGQWVSARLGAIRAVAESTTRTGKLLDIEQFSVSRYLFLRFNFTTGDAAGQNMTSRATSRACEWIRDRYPGIRYFCLESNMATDKKSSQLNVLATRGKRVVAELTIPRQIVPQTLRATPEQMIAARQVANLGGMLAGVNNNGNHSANGIAALFLATGQDVANVAESSAALVHAEILADGSYYYSITISAGIVATYGGGTGLPTQRECLELLGCYGSGKVLKFAEIAAATALCGELSLGSAIVTEEWVDAHERLGRNRP